MFRVVYPNDGPLKGKRLEVRYLDGVGWPKGFPESLEVPWDGRVQVYVKAHGKYLWKSSRACAMALRTEISPGIYITGDGQVLGEEDDIKGGIVQTEALK